MPRRFFPRSRSAARIKPFGFKRRLALESLEERHLLTAVTVNTNNDVNDGDTTSIAALIATPGADGFISLREAILAANTDTVTDDIAFDAGLDGGSILLTVAQGDLDITNPLNIDASALASGLTIDANDPTPGNPNADGIRIFNIDDGDAGIDSPVTLIGLTLTGGDVSGDGGAIQTVENLTLRRSNATGNASSGFGGGIANSTCALVLIDSTISDNSAVEDGGGINTLNGTLSLTNSTVSGNQAARGGGLYILNDTGSSSIANSTISGNVATELGGGIFNYNGLSSIQFSTITNNEAPDGSGSGIASYGDSLTTTEIYSTIIAGNVNSDIDFVDGDTNSFLSKGYNLIGFGNATAEFVEPGDQTGVADPLLSDLADNGGPTLTHRLRPNSPALDKGNPTAVANAGGVPEFDQRGTPFGRVRDGDGNLVAVIDIGAFELSPIIVNTLTDPAPVADDILSLREAIALANSTPGFDNIVFASSLFTGGAGIIQLTGEIEITEGLAIDGPGANLLTVKGGSRIFNITAITGDFTFDGITFTGGSTTGDNVDATDPTNSGGAIRCLSVDDLTFTGCVLTGNFTTGVFARGGAVFTAGNLILLDSTVSGNRTEGNDADGGAIFAQGTVTVSNSVVRDNHTQGNNAEGGGIYATGNFQLTRSTISGNRTTGNNSDGAGFYAFADATVTASTLSGNYTTANYSDGAGGFINGNEATIVNSTISGNRTEGEEADGAGIYALSNLVVRYSTITDNHVNGTDADGGGIWNNDNDLTIRNSIIAGNTAADNGPDVRPGAGTLTVDYSLIGDTTDSGINAGTGTGNILNEDPLLAPLEDNGGPTQTHRLLPGSPAIDSGDPAAVAGVGGVPEFDQRGTPFSRVRDGNGNGTVFIDMGAFEVEIDTGGPQVTDVFITGSPDYDLFAPKPTADGPTPAADSITIRISDPPPRAPGLSATALIELIAENPAHYLLVGDASGIIPIASVEVVFDPIVNGQPATASIILSFAKSLPDDRFTLTVSDAIRDPDGNLLDGESNAVQPISPTFPSGDGIPGGDFVARFTIDSRPEFGIWSGGSALVDINGNFLFDPTNADFTNRDLAFFLGFASDYVFSGNFVQDAAGTADGFDKLAIYGRVGSAWRWFIDFNNDGVPDVSFAEPAAVNGVPVAGNFDGNAANGDEVGIFTGTTWHLDTDHDFDLDTTLAASGYGGIPVVGDFNGDGNEDLATYDPSPGNNDFSVVVATAPHTWATTPTHSFVFGLFATPGGYSGLGGVRERPVAADMNADGIDDFGLWAPDGNLITPGGQAHWYFLVSGDDPFTPAEVEVSVLDRIENGFVPFRSVPFGNDLFGSFGSGYGIPLLGNFDPPVIGGLPLTTAKPVVVASSPTTTTSTPIVVQEKSAPKGSNRATKEETATQVVTTPTTISPPRLTTPAKSVEAAKPVSALAQRAQTTPVSSTPVLAKPIEQPAQSNSGAAEANGRKGRNNPVSSAVTIATTTSPAVNVVPPTPIVVTPPMAPGIPPVEVKKQLVEVLVAPVKIDTPPPIAQVEIKPVIAPLQTVQISPVEFKPVTPIVVAHSPTQPATSPARKGRAHANEAVASLVMTAQVTSAPVVDTLVQASTISTAKPIFIPPVTVAPLAISAGNVTTIEFSRNEFVPSFGVLEFKLASEAIAVVEEASFDHPNETVVSVSLTESTSTKLADANLAASSSETKYSAPNGLQSVRLKSAVQTSASPVKLHTPQLLERLPQLAIDEALASINNDVKFNDYPSDGHREFDPADEEALALAWQSWDQP